MRESWGLLPSVAVEKHSLKQTINGLSKYEHLFFLAGNCADLEPPFDSVERRTSKVLIKCQENSFCSDQHPISRTTAKSVFAIAGLVNALKNTK